VHFHEAFEAESEQAAIEELANWNAVENEPQALLAYNDGDGWFSVETGERLEPLDLEKAKDKVLVWHDKMPHGSGEAALRLLDVVVGLQNYVDKLKKLNVDMEARLPTMKKLGMDRSVASVQLENSKRAIQISRLEGILNGGF
jgi:hypothetical protein